MESYGTELKETPYPLIAALGARELQAKVLQHVRALNDEFVPKLHFVPLPREHRFPVKKEVREKHGTFPNQTQRDFEGYVAQGILKARWLKKHHELIPAVVLLFHEFDPRWSTREWMTQETILKEETDHLKRALAGRECRVLVILVEQGMEDAGGGGGGGSSWAAVTDERLGSLRRRVDADSKTLLLLRGRDLVRGASVLAKLESSIRNYALEYYKAQAKRVKRYKKALNKSSHQALHVRHSFKIAHYYEFRRYTTKVLLHYEMAYRAVLAMPLEETARSDGIGFCQVKTMAEFIHFKLCYHLIFSSNNIKGAVEQLHRHMRVYARAMGPVERAFEHWQWVSRQYHVFAQLLAEAVSMRGSLSVAGLDSEVFKEPYLYYMIAAKYATSRRTAAEGLGLSDPAVSAAAFAAAVRSSNADTQGAVTGDTSGFVVVPSVFVGGDSVVSETLVPVPSYGSFVKYLYAMERGVPHAKQTIHLLEQAHQYLSLYVADQKVPRQRLKSQLLVQIGVERLASNDFERARAELQKARTMFSGEQWWAQDTQILKKLLQCTSQQGDKTAFIDYSLQLLSPALQEYVTAPERLAIQSSFEQAWVDPVKLGGSFSAEPVLPSYEIILDHARPLFGVQARFDGVYACVREEMSLVVNVNSYFPAVIPIKKVEVLFSDERYNLMLHHRDGLDGVYHDESDSKWYASLRFDSARPAQWRIPLHVLDGREQVCYRETRFHFGSGRFFPSTASETASEESCLVFVLPFLNHNTLLRRNSKLNAVDGRVPVMGKGPGSPSFARRRQSIFSTTDSSQLSDADLADTDEGGIHTRNLALAILQPRAKATLELISKHALLSSDFRAIMFRLHSKEDSLTNATFRVTSEPPSTANNPLFYRKDDATGRLSPVELDDAMQPRDRVQLRDVAPKTSESFSVVMRSMQAGVLRLIINVAYTTKSGVQVSLEDRFDLQCKDSFSIKSGFIHDFPTTHGGGGTNKKDLCAVVGKPVNLQATLFCDTVEPVQVLSTSFERDESCEHASDLLTAGFNSFSDGEEDYDESFVLKKGDTRSVSLRFCPTQADPFVSLGRVVIRWRRLSSLVPVTEDQRNDIVTTRLDIPTVAFVDEPLVVLVETPAFGVEGSLLSVAIHLRNNGDSINRVHIKPTDDTGDFLISGRTNVTEDLLPLDEHVVRLGLIPTKSGYLRLPQLEIISVTTNLSCLNANESQELFIFPLHCATWKQVDSVDPVAR